MIFENENKILIGTVIFFDKIKGYGYIKTQEIKKDIFCHFSNINAIKFKYLEINTKVKFKIRKSDSFIQAVDINVIDE